MSSLKILTEHNVTYINQNMYKGRQIICACGDMFNDDWTMTGEFYGAQRQHNEHVAGFLEFQAREQRAEGFRRARDEIRALPCWIADTKHHGFDFGDDENGYAVETGARIYVMEILNNNPFTDEYVDPDTQRRKRRSVLQDRIDAGLADSITDREREIAQRILRRKANKGE